MNDNEKPNFEKLQRETSNHTTTQVPNNYYNKVPTCIILSVEELIDIRVKKIPIKEEGITLGVNHICNCSWILIVS